MFRRYELRGTEKRVLFADMKRHEDEKPHRCCLCGSVRSTGMAVNVMTGDDCRPHYYGKNLTWCGNVWVCPVCSAIIRSARADEMGEALDGWLADDAHGAKFVTLTIRHSRDVSLSREFDVFADAWRSLASGRWWRGWRDARGVVGYIRAVDITYSDANGWHLHWHMLMLTDGTGRDDVDGLAERWREKVGHVAPDCVPTLERGCVVETVGKNHGLTYYMNKLGSIGMTQELTQTELKSGRSSQSLTPFSLLSLAYDDDGRETLASSLFLEYTQATKGRSAVRWSRGLRDLLGLGKEKTDEETIEDAKKRGETIFRLSESLYKRLYRVGDDAVGGVLQAVDCDAPVGKVTDYIGRVCGVDVDCDTTDDGIPIVYLLDGSDCSCGKVPVIGDDGEAKFVGFAQFKGTTVNVVAGDDLLFGDDLLVLVENLKEKDDEAIVVDFEEFDGIAVGG